MEIWVDVCYVTMMIKWFLRMLSGANKHGRSEGLRKSSGGGGDCLPISCRSLLYRPPSVPWLAVAYKFSIDYIAQKWLITDKHRSRLLLNWGFSFSLQLEDSWDGELYVQQLFWSYWRHVWITVADGKYGQLYIHSPCSSQWAAGRARCCCPPPPSAAQTHWGETQDNFTCNTVKTTLHSNRQCASCDSHCVKSEHATTCTADWKRKKKKEEGAPA